MCTYKAISINKRYVLLGALFLSFISIVNAEQFVLFDKVFTFEKKDAIPTKSHLRVPLEELRRRDPKGIYRGFDAGEIKDVVGLNLPFDEPNSSDWILEFSPSQSVEKSVNELLNQLKSRIPL